MPKRSTCPFSVLSPCEVAEDLRLGAREYVPKPMDLGRVSRCRGGDCQEVDAASGVMRGTWPYAVEQGVGHKSGHIRASAEFLLNFASSQWHGDV